MKARINRLEKQTCSFLNHLNITTYPNGTFGTLYEPTIPHLEREVRGRNIFYPKCAHCQYSSDGRWPVTLSPIYCCNVGICKTCSQLNEARLESHCPMCDMINQG